MGANGNHVRVSRELLRISCRALSTISGDTDVILVPGASQELLELLVDIVYGGGENTKLYSSVAIERFFSLGEALGIGELEIVASPPNSQESGISPAASPSRTFSVSPRSSPHGGQVEATGEDDLLPQSPDPGAKDLHLQICLHLV